MLALGEYRYTGFIGPKPPWQDMLDDVKPYLEIVRMHLQRTLTRLRAMLAAPAEAHK
jgi:hypothetical protein